MAFSKNQNGADNLSLFISSKVAASGTITFEATGAKTPFTTQPNQVTRVVLANTPTLSDDFEVSTSMLAGKKTLRVQADQDVSVYGLSLKAASADAVLAFPVTALGTTYRAVAYPGAPISLGGTIRHPSFLMVVATEDGTTVSVTPSTYSQDTVGVEYAPGFSFSTPLVRGQVVQVYSGDSARINKSDLTGSLITSNKPVAVFSGAKCAEVPVDTHYCDHLYEQIPPTTTWGKSFFMSPMQSRASYIYRVVADQDGTEVRIDGALLATLAAGKFFEASAATAKSISTSKPSLVMQYAVSGNVDSPFDDTTRSNGDPFMQLISPSDQYLSDYTIATADSNPTSPLFTRNYLSIVAPVTPGSSVPPVVSVNGQVIAASDFTLSAQQDFFYVNQTVQPGSFRVQSNVGVGVNMYGFTNVNSYGYTAGMNFSPITAINDIKLTPSDNVSRWVGTQHCVTALVTDSSNQPLSSIKVDVATSGANTSLNSVYTNAAGQAPYCYTSTAAGKDTLTLSSGGKSATSTVLWLQDSGANAPTLTLTPATATQTVNLQQCVVAKMVDSQSQPIVNLAMSLGAAGVNSPAAIQPSTDSAGEAQFCYTGAAMGTDTVTAATGPLSKTAAISWILPPPTATDDNFGNIPAQKPLTGNVLTNDGAAPGNTAVLDTNVLHGMLSLQPDGNFTYTSTGSYTGPESFTYHVNSSTSGNSNVAKVVFNVVPSALDDSYSATAGVALNQAAPGVLINDLATSGKATVATQPGNGSLTLNADGSFVYVANSGFSGIDRFTYTISDAAGASAAATVAITVGTPGKPVGGGDSYKTKSGETLTISAPGVLANDTGPVGAKLTASVVTPPANGTLTLNADGSFVYTPKAKFEGTDTFTYIASYDSSKSARTKAAPMVDSDPVTVTITVSSTTPVVTATPVPALGHVGLVLLSGLLAGAAALRRRRS
ncbi:IPTL-CTERM sorting domain-containing protein [Diaphorobacter sp. HDW4B]|uniref:IPTL-CTERM sorting domain-containing protein n=1 Tax=Diaphorobacter sp. HDW4B TaxID=2714925 RepID=UPI00140D8A83|nr:IPTL-CTERM sorting domain-containing protein [Diaphorobacter sp. HDW4B]QIL72458.1 IPTL-CTERM sorting domain-containing protein [Diaphorobacter sp. HDW4B]